METIKYNKAQEKYNIEKYLKAPFFEDAEVNVHSENCFIDGDFDISERGNNLFLQDLNISGKIFNSCDGEGPVFLLVMGNCKAKNITIDEPLVYIKGNLIVEKEIMTDYNHGYLEIRGNVSAQIICAEHHTIVGGQIQGETIDLGGLKVEDKNFKPTISREQLSEASSYLVDEVLTNGQLDLEAILERIESGKPILR
jgi:hypothetical protein